MNKLQYKRGDIVKVYFKLPKQKEDKYHPAVIISNNSLFEAEEMYLCAMMTTSSQTDIFTFRVEDDMLQFPLKVTFSQVRCHLISYVEHKHIESFNGNTMKPQYVNKLIEQINTVCLEDDDY